MPDNTRPLAWRCETRAGPHDLARLSILLYVDRRRIGGSGRIAIRARIRHLFQRMIVNASA
jgi:hypothetical protein